MKTWKIGDTIPFRARISGNPVVDNPIATVRDETDTIEGTPLTLGSGLTQVGATKIVKGSFVPDAQGIWSVQIVDDTGMDIVKQFIVGDYSISSIGALAATIESKIDAQNLVLTQILGQTATGGGHFG
jgi:hypothetical protein